MSRLVALMELLSAMHCYWLSKISQCGIFVAGCVQYLWHCENTVQAGLCLEKVGLHMVVVAGSGLLAHMTCNLHALLFLHSIHVCTIWYRTMQNLLCLPSAAYDTSPSYGGGSYQPEGSLHKDPQHA